MSGESGAVNVRQEAIQELLDNPDLHVAGVRRSEDPRFDIASPKWPFDGRGGAPLYCEVDKLEIFARPTVPTYDVFALNRYLATLLPNVPQRRAYSFIRNTGRRFDELNLGKVLFTESIGRLSLTHTANIEIDEDIVDEIEDVEESAWQTATQQSLEIQRTTRISLYPDQGHLEDALLMPDGFRFNKYGWEIIQFSDLGKSLEGRDLSATGLVSPTLA